MPREVAQIGQVENQMIKEGLSIASSFTQVLVR